jgi:hypothetical protein
MKTLSTAIVLTALLVLPSGATAKPDPSDKRAAIAQCKSERGKTKATRKAFKAKYHGFSRNEVAAFKNAAKQCQAESADPNFAAGHGGRTFAELYGTNKNRRNAFGKCVSSKTFNYTDPLS